MWVRDKAIKEELLLCDVRERKLTTKEHWQALEDTAFALCPRGNNVETFRFYEAMETGAIPILVRSENREDDFLQHGFFKKYPGPVLGSWDELPGYIFSMYDPRRVKELDTLQKAMGVWYERFKETVRGDLSRSLDGLMADRMNSTISL